MTVRDECAERGRSILLLRRHLGTIDEALVPDRIHWEAMREAVDRARERIRENFGLFELARAKGHIDEKTHTDLRVRLQDVEGRLPAVIREDISLGEYGALIEPSLHALDRLMDKVEDVMFQAVVDCELRR